MKQLLQNMRNGKTTIADVPIPVPGPGRALVKVSASLVSAGTERMVVEFAEKNLAGKARSRPDLVHQVVDKARREGVVPTLRAAFNRLDQPMTLGYASAGTICALGSEMEGFRIGQRVACAGGGYAVHAEYDLVPRNLLTLLPENVDFESAAFTTLGAIALHGFRLAEAQLGHSVAVIGLGLLGLLAVQIAKAAGCRVIGIDLDARRVALAQSFGVQAVGRGEAEEAVRRFTSNHGSDIVLICADTPANDPVELAGTIACDRAKIVATGAVGLALPRKIYYEKELSFINSRSYGPGRYDPDYEDNGQDYPSGYVRWTEGRNFQEVVGLLQDGKLDVKPLISHRFPIEKAGEAYEVIMGKKKEPFLGVLLTYPGEETGEPVSRIQLSSARVPGKITAIGTVKLGVLGAGLFANATLLPAIKKQKGIEFVGIASQSGVHAQQAGRKFGFSYAAADDEQILNDPEINTVAILTRHNTHAELVVKALQAGKNVFVEKPVAINAEQLGEILEALKVERSPLLAVGFNRRFAPLTTELSHFLENRREPLHAHYRVNAGPIPLNHWTQDPQVGGGRIIGEGCHFVDFLTFLVGAAPIDLVALGLPDGGRYREDNVSLTCTFPDGSIGIVDYLANGDKAYPKERVEVFCGGRIAVLEDFRSLELVRDGHKRTVRKAQDKGWEAEWAAFVRAVREGSGPTIPYDQLIGVTKATFAAIDSMRRGEKVRVA